MEKSEMIVRYESETGKSARDELYSGSIKLYMPTNDYIAWLEAKAAAYDRLMSGGRKTLKEWANFLGKPVAIDIKNRLLWFPKKPEIGLTTWIWYDNEFGCFGEYLPKNLFNYAGEWKDSLTFPDGWEESNAR